MGARETAGGRTRGVRWEAWDAALYALGAIVAGVAALSDTIPIQRVWGRIAVGPYAAATLVAVALALQVSRGSLRHRHRARGVVLSAVIVGVVLTPLVLEVTWRSSVGVRGHVQSEVLVTEASADALLEGRDPYAASFVEGDLGAWPPGTAEHVPYLPGIFAFGMPRAIAGPGAPTDARLAFAAVAFLALGLALARSDAPVERRITALAVVVALPTGARYLVGGGDDVAVLSLMLLSLVLLRERRPGWAGLIAGLAAVVKQTAWPLLPFLVIAARDRDGRPAAGRSLAGVASAIVPAVLPFALWDPRAFLEDVVLFPFGLARDPTLAASPTLGRLVAEVVPIDRGVLAAGLMLVVLAVGVYLLVVRPPVDARGAAERAALVLLLAIVLATAGRFGYLLYPIGLFAWARLVLLPTPRSAPTQVPLEALRFPAFREDARAAKGSGL